MSACCARGELQRDGANAPRRRGTLPTASTPGECHARVYDVCKHRAAFPPQTISEGCSRYAPMLDKLDRLCQSAVSRCAGSPCTSDHPLLGHDVIFRSNPPQLTLFCHCIWGNSLSNEWLTENPVNPNYRCNSITIAFTPTCCESYVFWRKSMHVTWSRMRDNRAGTRTRYRRSVDRTKINSFIIARNFSI